MAKDIQNKGHSEHLSPQSETIFARNGLHLIDLLAKGVTWKPPNYSGYYQGHSLQTDGKLLLLKPTFMYLIEHRKVELGSTRDFTSTD